MKPRVPSLIAASATERPLTKKARVVGVLILAFSLIATPMLMPSAGNAQDARVAKSMAALKDQTAKLGAPKLEGSERGWRQGCSCPVFRLNQNEQQLHRGR